MVLINASIDALRFPRVSTDDLVAVNQAMGHLVSLGHTRIGLLLGPHDHVPSLRKFEAAVQFADRHRIEVGGSLVVHSHYSLESGQASAKRLLEAGASAIVCASDPLALGAIRAARRQGLSIPRDVSIVGFDDSALMNFIDPALTTVRQPIEPMGRAVVDLLVGMISGATVSRDELLFEPELVVRGSTSRAPHRTRSGG